MSDPIVRKLGKIVGLDEGDTTELTHSEDAEELLSEPSRSGQVKVELDDGKEVSAYSMDKSDPRFPAWVSFLRSRYDSGYSVYIEAEGNSVIELFGPGRRMVTGINADSPDGRLVITLLPTPALRFLSPGNPRFDDLKAKLEAALESGEEVYVTVSPYNDEVVDVSPVEEGEPESGLSNGLLGLLEEVALEEFTIETVASNLSPFSITFTDAIREFDFLRTRPEIPFDFITDCCTARAHKMCDLLRQHSIQSEKVWLYGSRFIALKANYALTDATLRGFHEDNPGVVAHWLFHVAPVVSVIQDDGSTNLMVMDPSEFHSPRLVNTWVRHHGDLGARFEFSTARVSFRSPEGQTTFDDNFSQTNENLNKHKHQSNLLRLPRLLR